MSKHLDQGTAERVSMGVIRLTKLLQALRQQAPRLHPAVEPSAYPILFNLRDEPRRVSTLAGCIHSDVSTVSRQVSNLVGHGLLEKVSDPQDRRAQMVQLSAEGQELIATLQESRNTWFAELLADWNTKDATAFAGYLERFADTLEAARHRHTQES